jgi:hypothetical protein
MKHDLDQYCSIKKNSVRPELVEGLLMSSWWFDKPVLSEVEGLTTNGLVQSFLNLTLILGSDNGYR